MRFHAFFALTPLLLTQSVGAQSSCAQSICEQPLCQQPRCEQSACELPSVSEEVCCLDDPVLEFPTLCDPVWAFGVDWLFLCRDNGHDPTVLVSCTCPDGSNTFRARQVDPDSGSGARLRAYRRNPNGVDFEASYLDISDWNHRRDLAGDLTVVGTAIGDGVAFSQFDSQLRGVELNALVDIDAWSRWKAGVRWMQLDDFQRLEGDGTLSSVAATADVRNQLIGGQLGYNSLIYDQGGPWTMDLALEAGLFANLAERRTTGYGAIDGDEERLAAIGEIEIGTNYALSRCWSLRFGAQFLWLTDVAAAPAQFGSPTGLYANSTLFYAGGSLGLTSVW